MTHLDPDTIVAEYRGGLTMPQIATKYRVACKKISIIVRAGTTEEERAAKRSNGQQSRPADKREFGFVADQAKRANQILSNCYAKENLTIRPSRKWAGGQGSHASYCGSAGAMCADAA